MKHQKTLSTLFIGAAIVAVVAIAASPVRAADTIPTLSGGVGADSTAMIKSREKEFNLKLVLTLVEGDYVYGARVRIAAGAKELATHAAEGPFFLARLPAGAYNVTVDYAGQTQTRKVDVRADRLLTEHIRFKRDAGDTPAPRQ